jgi:hypothetical protein
MYLTADPTVLFCPGADQTIGIESELAKVGVTQAQGSYYYRHASITEQYDIPASAGKSVEHILLSRLGDNRNLLPIRALAIDSQFPAPDGLAPYGIFPRTHHEMKWEPRLRGNAVLREALGAEVLVHFTVEARRAVTSDVRELAEDVGDDRALEQLRRDSPRATLVGRFSPHTRIREGDQLEAAVDPHALHFFDAESGDAIRDAQHSST